MNVDNKSYEIKTFNRVIRRLKKTVDKVTDSTVNKCPQDIHKL